ncbi:hypothetical protein SKAU_G00376810 [Synaphobranchus kaupii]|uniref:Uncharacterized protein n=1 Tax=Synaphobranchus kaupii TaxID=118154 RepID=A0A9Q1ECW2_SYNKA|nr:hypothetical protein SKAU_G00376810 [Synaphobranchus kaupii]
MSISRPSAAIGKCRMIRHDRDKQNEPNPQRFDRIAHTRETMNRDGINSLSYKVIKLERDRLYTKVTVGRGQALSVTLRQERPLTTRRERDRREREKKLLLTRVMSLACDVGRGTSRPLGLAGGGAVQGLLESERRCRALELSLAKANRAMQDQYLRMMQQQTPHPSPEDWIPQHWVLALKVRDFKAAKSNGFSSEGFNSVQYSNLYERIGKLRSDLDVLSQKVDQVCQTAGGCWHWCARWPVPDRPLPVLDRPHPAGHPGPKLPTAPLVALAMDHSQLQRERGDLERLVQDAWGRLGVLERDREVLGSQVTGLHSELFQTRSREQDLQRDGISARAELTGSRQMNDSLLQEMAVLRQRLACSEERVALMESERSVQAARLVALETERGQLLSQKALLVRRLWRDPGAGHRPPGAPGATLETDVGGDGMEEIEEVVEAGREVMKTQVVHPRHPSGEEFPESLSLLIAQPSKVETGDQTEDMVQLSEHPRKGLEDTDCQQLKLQASPEVHERRSIEFADWGEMGGVLRNQKDFPIQEKPRTVHCPEQSECPIWEAPLC